MSRELASMLRDKRRELKLSLHELSKVSGVTEAIIVAAEEGEYSSLSLADLRKLAYALRIEAYELGASILNDTELE